MKSVLEICCGSFEDVKTAYENGADRVELNSALYLGGLTPSLANLICAKEQCEIPVVAMVRPRGGGFCYSLEEYQTMILDTKLLLEHGADRFRIFKREPDLRYRTDKRTHPPDT